MQLLFVKKIAQYMFFRKKIKIWPQKFCTPGILSVFPTKLSCSWLILLFQKKLYWIFSVLGKKKHNNPKSVCLWEVSNLVIFPLKKGSKNIEKHAFWGFFDKKRMFCVSGRHKNYSINSSAYRILCTIVVFSGKC